ncbi:DUF7310 family coiled-coil domain-containing protein [Halorientalis halophila]|uniref:DUF7310 family coiled-coil domain-containing protein n=1 Tax=Halorientalis halophila TaxID=3108499 RepID=UPI003008255A
MVDEDIEARLEAVERALADGEADLSGVAGAADHGRELDSLTDRVEELESRLDDLAASVQAVRGYVGNVRTVNRDVERRADAALAKAEALEERVDGSGDRRPDGSADPARNSTPGPSGRETPPREEHTVDERTDEGRREETPGEVARRITETSDQRGRDAARGRPGPDPARERHRSARGRPRDSHATPSETDGDDGDGLLAGLRDAL